MLIFRYRRKPLPGGCGQNVLFCTLWKINPRSLLKRARRSPQPRRRNLAPDCASRFGALLASAALLHPREGRDVTSPLSDRRRYMTQYLK